MCTHVYRILVEKGEKVDFVHKQILHHHLRTLHKDSTSVRVPNRNTR